MTSPSDFTANRRLDEALNGRRAHGIRVSAECRIGHPTSADRFFGAVGSKLHVAGLGVRRGHSTVIKALKSLHRRAPRSQVAFRTTYITTKTNLTPPYIARRKDPPMFKSSHSHHTHKPEAKRTQSSASVHQHHACSQGGPDYRCTVPGPYFDALEA